MSTMYTRLALWLFLASPLVQGETIYTRKDENGVTHFGDARSRPSREAETLSLQPINTYTAAPVISSTQSSAPAPRKVQTLELYTTQSCGYCRRAKAYLRAKGVAFTEYDVDRDAKARKRFQSLGGKGVPLTVAGALTMRGFSPKGMDRFLRKVRGE